MSNEINLTESNFDSEVLQSDKPVIIDFWAEWCGPCKAFFPVLDEFEAENPDIKVCKVNVDEAPVLGQKYNVMSIPTIVFIKDGQAVHTSVGSMSKKDLEEQANVLK